MTPTVLPDGVVEEVIAPVEPVAPLPTSNPEALGENYGTAGDIIDTGIN